MPTLRGLYAIADTGWLAEGQLLDAVAQAIRGGAALIQFRTKQAVSARMRDELRQLHALCRSRRVPLIINDDVGLARKLGAEGVHLGRDDATVAAARRELGPGVIIGASCYNRYDLALAAARDGADYVAFGRFFPSPTKPEAVAADPALTSRESEWP